MNDVKKTFMSLIGLTYAAVAALATEALGNKEDKITCACRRHFNNKCGKTLEQKDPAFPICYDCYTNGRCNNGT